MKRFKNYFIAYNGFNKDGKLIVQGSFTLQATKCDLNMFTIECMKTARTKSKDIFNTVISCVSMVK